MEIVSPYGKNITGELQQIYKLESIAELLERVRHFLAQDYGFETVSIEQIHIAFGIAIRFSYGEERYYLKFTGRANHRQPEALFEYHDYLRRQGIPLPEVLKTADKVYFKTILESPWYYVTYVMKAVRGQVIRRKTQRRLEQYIRVIAEFHRLGADYEPHVISGYRKLNDFFREALEGLEHFNLKANQPTLLGRTTDSIKNVLDDLEGHNDLSKTHIHGDFRLCHVMFKNQGVSGMIDAEHMTYAERIWDICVGLVSHPNPARCLLLDLEEMLELLRFYDRLYPLTKADYRALKGMLQLALLSELAGTLLFLGTGKSETKIQDARRLWQTLARVNRLSDNLGLAKESTALSL